MHKKAHKEYAKHTEIKDQDNLNCFLRSHETKINLFVSDGAKPVWKQPGEEYKS